MVVAQFIHILILRSIRSTGGRFVGRKAPVTRGVGGDLLDDDREPGLEDLLVSIFL